MIVISIYDFCKNNRPAHEYYGSWNGVAQIDKNGLEPAPVSAYWRMCDQLWIPQDDGPPACLPTDLGWVRVLFRGVDKKKYTSTGDIRIDKCLVEQYSTSCCPRPLSRGFVPVWTMSRFAICVTDVNDELVTGDVVEIVDSLHNSHENLTVRKHFADHSKLDNNVHSAPAWFFGPVPNDLRINIITSDISSD